MTPLDRVLAQPFVTHLARRLANRAPSAIAVDGDTRRAAVALILRMDDASAMELLLIKRAAWEGDPWSGHVALPGGRQEAGETLEQTAVRETREETGLDLVLNGAMLGQLDDVQPRATLVPRFVITPFVAVTSGAGRVTGSDEVAEAFWIPVEVLRAPGVAREAMLELTGGPRRVSSFQYRDYTIWGLTERILQPFMALSAAA